MQSFNRIFVRSFSEDGINNPIFSIFKKYIVKYMERSDMSRSYRHPRIAHLSKIYCEADIFKSGEKEWDTKALKNIINPLLVPLSSGLIRY